MLFLFCSIDGYDDDLSGGAKLDYQLNWIAAECRPFYSILRFMSDPIALTFLDGAGHDRVLDIVDGQLIVVHLFFGMQRHDEAPLADAILHIRQCSSKDAEFVPQPFILR